jgi:hypothetical protein
MVAAGAARWSLSLRACRASPTRSRDADAAMRTSARSGRISCASFAKCAPPWSSSSTCHPSLPGIDRSAIDFRGWATSIKRASSARRRWARRIGASGCSSWPTLVTTDASGTANATARRFTRRHHAGRTLTDAMRLWPTPVARDDQKSPQAHLSMKARMKGGPRRSITSLEVVVKLWNAPDTDSADSRLETGLRTGGAARAPDGASERRDRRRGAEVALSSDDTVVDAASDGWREGRAASTVGDGWTASVVASVGLGDANGAGLENRLPGAEPAAQPAPWPPSPADADGWRAVLAVRPDLAPSVERDVLRVADRMAARVDRLRGVGNGVVPLVAAYAFCTLAAQVGLDVERLGNSDDR